MKLWQTLIAMILALALGIVATHYYPIAKQPAKQLKLIHAVYWPAWSNRAVTARTYICGERNGVFYFKAIDHPVGWAFFSLNNLRYGLCLDEEVPNSPLEIESSPLVMK